MEVLSLTGVPRTYGEVYSLVRRRRDERAVKDLPPFGLHHKMATGYPLSSGGAQAARGGADSRSGVGALRKEGGTYGSGSSSSASPPSSHASKTVLWTEVLVLKYLFHSAALGSGREIHRNVDRIGESRKKGDAMALPSCTAPADPFCATSSLTLGRTASAPVSLSCTATTSATNPERNQKVLEMEEEKSDPFTFAFPEGQQREEQGVVTEERGMAVGGGSPPPSMVPPILSLYGPSSVYDAVPLHHHHLPLHPDTSFICKCVTQVSHPKKASLVAPFFHTSSASASPPLLSVGTEMGAGWGLDKALSSPQQRVEGSASPSAKKKNPVVVCDAPHRPCGERWEDVGTGTSRGRDHDTNCYFFLLREWHAVLSDALHVSTSLPRPSEVQGGTSEKNAAPPQRGKSIKSGEEGRHTAACLSSSSSSLLAVEAMLSLYESHGRQYEAQWARRIRQLVQALASYRWNMQYGSMRRRPNAVRDASWGVPSIGKRKTQDGQEKEHLGTPLSLRFESNTGKEESTGGGNTEINAQEGAWGRQTMKHSTFLGDAVSFSTAANASFVCQSFETLLASPTPLARVAVGRGYSKRNTPVLTTTDRVVIAMGNRTDGHKDSLGNRNALCSSSSPSYFFSTARREGPARGMAVSSSTLDPSRAASFFILCDLEVLALVNARPQRMMEVYRVVEDLTTRWEEWAAAAGLTSFLREEEEGETQDVPIPRDADSFAECIVQIFKHPL